MTSAALSDGRFRMDTAWRRLVYASVLPCSLPPVSCSRLAMDEAPCGLVLAVGVAPGVGSYWVREAVLTAAL
jgi:hypothetical protein